MFGLSVDRRLMNRIPVTIVISCFVIFFIMNTIVFHRMTSIIKQQNVDSAMMEAQGVSHGIGADVIKRVVAGDEEAKLRLDKTLGNQMKSGNKIHRLYVIALVEGKGRVIADTNSDTDFDSYVFDANELKALDGQSFAFCTDVWQPVMSYMAVRDEAGVVAGVLCIESSPDRLRRYLVALRLTIAIVTLVFCFLMFFVYIITSYDISNRDVLTRIPNYECMIRYGLRISMKDKMNQYTAAIVNIKGFKNINQKYGYDEGNRCLIKLAWQLSKFTKHGDFVARIGSDTFVILLLNRNTESYIEKLKDRNPSTYGDVDTNTLAAPIRCGIYKACDTDTIERVISICTVSMNRSRERGNLDFVYYDDDIYKQAIKNGDILASYKKAIQNGEFKVFYQPKVNTESQILCGAEALVRWYRGGNFLPPVCFVPLLEDEGLIVELDEYVLKTVCEDISRWKSKGFKPIKISVNFSKVHLDNPLFADNVVSIIDNADISHECIIIEMTESSGYSNLEAFKSFVNRMVDENITVSMDDFGTGYSSLSLLGDIRMHEVKIDKSFIDRIFVSRENSRFVTNVIQMIKDLNRLVVCEGVETKKQYEFVKNAGCDVIQGYYYDTPLSKNDFEKRMMHPDYVLKE